MVWCTWPSGFYPGYPMSRENRNTLQNTKDLIILTRIMIPFHIDRYFKLSAVEFHYFPQLQDRWKTKENVQ